VCLNHRPVRLWARWRGIVESHQVRLVRSHISSSLDQAEQSIPMVWIDCALSGAISLLADSMEIR
jgi:hypothetical protein